MKLFQVEVLDTLTNAVETIYILGNTKRSAMNYVTDFKSDNDEVLSVKMTNKEFTKHYLNILNFPDLGIYPERRYDLHDEIQRLADIDKISYHFALNKICSIFSRQYDLETEHDDINYKKIETASTNLFFLRAMEGLDILRKTLL